MEICPLGVTLICVDMMKLIDTFVSMRTCLKTEQTKSENTVFQTDHCTTKNIHRLSNIIGDQTIGHSSNALNWYAGNARLKPWPGHQLSGFWFFSLTLQANSGPQMLPLKPF